MILDEIAAKTRERVARCKENVSPEEMKKKALSLPSETGFPFEKQLKKDGVSFICEIKKASPSEGDRSECRAFDLFAFERGDPSGVDHTEPQSWTFGIGGGA